MVGRIAVALLLMSTPAWAQSKQAVLDTTAGTIVMDLLADKAPAHVALFIKTAESGGYDGTTFFRMIKYGIIQGCDATTKDPAARAKYGTGGLNLLKPEINDEKQTRGAVSATLIPGKADSAGTQFFMSSCPFIAMLPDREPSRLPWRRPRTSRACARRSRRRRRPQRARARSPARDRDVRP